MMELVTFKREHILPLLDQPINLPLKEVWLSSLIEEMTDKDMTILIDGKVAACGGIKDIWPGRGHVWTVFNQDFKKCFLPVFRGIKKFLEMKQKEYNRIEISISPHLTDAIRRAKLLGFECETERAKKFFPDGSDATIYVLEGKCQPVN